MNRELVIQNYRNSHVTCILSRKNMNAINVVTHYAISSVCVSFISVYEVKIINIKNVLMDNEQYLIFH